MALEHELVFETHPAIPFIVNNAQNYEKGTVMRIVDPFTVSGASVVNEIVGGILKIEKVSGSGIASAAIYRGGIFRATASGTVTVGDPLKTATNNEVMTAIINTATFGGTASGANLIGVSLETATATQTFLYELRPQRVFTP